MRRVFAIPALMALLTVAGLLSALLFEEAGPPLSWLALAVPLIILTWHLLRFARLRRRSD